MGDEIQREVIMNRLADGVKQYVENYLIVQNSGGKLLLKPTYEVNYQISDDVIEKMNKSFEDGIENAWCFEYMNCNSINELPDYVRTITIQYLPRFFEDYPQYIDEDCLMY